MRQSVPSPHIPSVPDGRGAVVERVAVHRAWVGRFPTLIRDGLAAAMRHRHLAAAPLVCRRPPAQRHHTWRSFVRRGHFCRRAPRRSIRARDPHPAAPPRWAPGGASGCRSACTQGCRTLCRLYTGLQDTVPPVHRVGCRAACTQGCSRAIARMHRGAGHDAEAPLDREAIAY